MPSFLQSVRARTLVIMLGVVAAVLVGLGAWAQGLLRQSFERLEAAEAVEKLQLARQTFDERCDALSAAAVTWSRTAASGDALTLATLPGGAALLFEAHLENVGAPELGRVVLGDETLVGEIPGLLGRVAPLDALHALGTSGRALTSSAGRLLLVVWTYQVLPNGMIGAVVAGSWLDEAWIERFAESVHHRTRLVPRTGFPLAARELHELDGPHGMVLQAIDEEELLGHVRIDLSGGPLVLSLSLDRGIVAAGGVTWEILMTAIIVTGGLLVLASMMLLDWSVLARLTRLGHRLAEIGQTNDQKSLVNESGADEVGRIGREINRLLASQRGWREQISRRNISMRMIFDTLPIGLLSLDTQGRIQPDRSSATGDLFGRHDLDGLDLGELLAPGPQGVVTRRRLSDYLAIVRAGTVDAEQLDDINPVKAVTVQRANGPSVLRLQFYSMEHGRTTTRRLRRDPGGVADASGVLVTISDISDERRLAAEVERSQSDYQQLKAMAEDVDLFHGFLVNIRGLVRQLNDLSGRMGSAPDRVHLSDLQRSVRALRSGGEIFELVGLEQAARSFDAELVRYLGMANLSDAEVRRCRYGVADLEAAVMAIERQFRALLGHEEEAAVTAPQRTGHRGPPPRTQEELRVAKRSTLVQLAGLLVQPVRIGLAATIRVVVPMVRRRGGEVRFAVQGEEVPIDQAHVEVLNQVLPHVVRFACDHGFDAPELREQAGKPPLPLLTLGVERRERSLVVTIADDGHGIDPGRMRQLAVEQNLMTREAAEALADTQAQALVFSVTTDSGDNSLSGVRQVGFDLIVNRLKEELNADVAVQSTPGQGTAVIITIPLPML